MTGDLAVATDIAEFMLNDVDLTQPSLASKLPTRAEIGRLLERDYYRGDRFVTSCHQDVIMMRQRA